MLAVLSIAPIQRVRLCGVSSCTNGRTDFVYPHTVLESFTVDLLFPNGVVGQCFFLTEHQSKAMYGYPAGTMQQSEMGLVRMDKSLISMQMAY